ncbi:MAG: ABC transporter substrate-binding protein [Candidatus Caenarcaniphilales bacterium]|nr:ABC transporter substrate-binding protein [Candidatus Caenarcaniphilales bacterium]
MALGRSSKLIILFSILLLLNACSHSDIKSKDPDSKFGGILKLTQRGQDAKTLNPWIATDASSSQYGSMMFLGLLKFDPDTDQPLPLLAESFKISKDQKTITVTMKENIFWSDDEEITVDDVLFTWNNLLRDQIAISMSRDIILVDGEFPEVKKLSKQTIQFKTKTIFAPFLRNLGLEIAPKHHVLEHLRKANAKTLKEQQLAFNNYLNIHSKAEDIVCSGAFKFSKIQSGERIEFVRNPRYFETDSETGKNLPYIDRIIYSYVQDDSADIFKFLSGESMILGVSPNNAAFIKSMEKKYDYKLMDLGPSQASNFIWFNMSKNIPEPKYSWFNSKAFREAVSLAIDRENIINNVFQGLGSPLNTAFPDISPFYNPKVKVDPLAETSKALQVLKQAGFTLKTNPETKEKELYDSKSNRVEFDLFTNSGNKERELMGVIISENLKEIGIKANFKLLEFNNFVGKIMSAKDYDAGVLGFSGGSSNEPNSGANVWNSTGRLHAFDPKATQENPLTRSWEKEIDSIFSRGVKTMDFNERKEIYDKFQEIVFREKPFIYLATPRVFTAVSKDLGGIRKTKYAGIIPDLAKVYIKN